MTEPTKNNLDLISEPIPKGKLEKTKEENEIYDEQSKGSKNKHKHNVFICGLYFITILAISILGIRVWHYVASESYQWMSDVQLQSLDKFLSTGLVGTLLGRYGNKLIQ